MVLSGTLYCYCVNYNSLITDELVQFCVNTKSEDINQDLQTLQIPVHGTSGSKRVKKNVPLIMSV